MIFTSIVSGSSGYARVWFFCLRWNLVQYQVHSSQQLIDFDTFITGCSGIKSALNRPASSFPGRIFQPVSAVPYSFCRSAVPTLPEVRIASTTFLCVDSNRICPFAETVTVPLQIFLVIWRHMFRYRGVLAAPAMETAMRGNPVVMIKYFNRCFCYAHIDLIFDILIRHRVVHFVYGDVIVELDSGLFHSASSKGVAGNGASNGFSSPRNKLSLLQSFFWNFPGIVGIQLFTDCSV